MIPKTSGLEREIGLRRMAGKTYRLDSETGRISGMVDGLEAMRQAIYKILATERYDWLIYSWNYGAELKDLIGMPTELVCAYVKARITEALLQDDRVRAVQDFVCERRRNVVAVSFTAVTTEGMVEAEKVVAI